MQETKVSLTFEFADFNIQEKVTSMMRLSKISSSKRCCTSLGYKKVDFDRDNLETLNRPP